MKIYCINLKRSSERRAKMEAEFKKLSHPNEFIEAVDGHSLSSQKRKAVYSYLGTLFRHGVSLTEGELGCVLSHLKFFARVVADNKPAALFEDDITIDASAHQALEEAETFLENTNQPTLVQFPGLARDLRTDDSGKMVKVQGAIGAYAYAVNVAGAKLLLKAYTPIKMPSDRYSYLIRKYGLDFYVYPKIVVGVDMSGKSEIGSDRFVKFTGFRSLIFKIWRCVGVALDAILSRKDWR